MGPCLLLLLSSKCDSRSHGCEQFLQIHGHSHLTLFLPSTPPLPHSPCVHILCCLWSACTMQTPIFLLLYVKPGTALSLQYLLWVSGASLFLSPPLSGHWSQGCSGHTCISSPECVLCLRNGYLTLRHQARSFLKLNPGIKQLWNRVYLKWEGQVFDNHQHNCPTISFCLFDLVFSGVFFYTRLYFRG